MKLPLLVSVCIVLGLPCALAAEQDLAKMQECMKNIDQSAMQKIAAEGESLAAETRTLCAAGKRDEAQEAARAYGMKMKSSPVLQQLRECGMQVSIKFSEGSGDGHVCDGQ